MTQMTHLAHNLDSTEYVSKYDVAAKRLISNKQVLAHIVKGAVAEFKDYSIEEITAGIEQEPKVAVHEIYPGKSGKRKDVGAIRGMNTESVILGEGKITYDIYFHVLTREKCPVKIIINIELQKDYYPGYDLGTRGVFYGARMLSEQLDTEFFADDYDNMKKVYSIWICMEAPEKYANTITVCSMNQEELYGDYQENVNCDFLSVIIIRLSAKDNYDSRNELIRMLTILLSQKIDAKTKKQELSQRYGMVMTEEIKGGLKSMGSLGEGLLERRSREIAAKLLKKI